MAERIGLYFARSREEADTLAEELLQSPEKFASSRGLSLPELECPDAAHEALNRGSGFAAEVASAEIRLDSPSMDKLRQIATKHLGPDYEVTMIPFGLRFREKLTVVKPEWTATATGTVTFLDTDSDVDG